MKRIFLVLFILMVFFSVVMFAKYYEEKKLNLKAEDLKGLKIKCGAGYLKVYADENITNIEVIARINVRKGSETQGKEMVEKYLELYLEERDNQGLLVSKVKEFKMNFFSRIFKNANIYVDLMVKVPNWFNLDVNDGSGDIEIKNIGGEVYVNDGSGDMELLRIGNNTVINDGSGNISIDNIQGNLKIIDGSGEIKAQNINGNLKINDGSGEIVLKGILGQEVKITDGSGNIDLVDCQGKLEISDGSGEIYVEKINNDVKIRDGSGTIIVRSVKGSVYIRDGSGSINIDGVAKDVIIYSSGSGGESINNVKGKVSVKD